MQTNKRFLSILSILFLLGCASEPAIDSSATGQGGSMTRFAISNHYLYVVDNAKINVFDISDHTFKKLNAVSVESGLETIFARGEYLYLGANDAMYIYSIARPESPEFIFRYAHIVSCDPVVVQGNRAYVTLRNGTWCNRGNNALEIIDISNPYDPVLISNHSMQSPHGLAVDQNLVFLCEGEFGLKVFDISNENEIILLEHVVSLHAYDVIARNGMLIVTGEDGVSQYRYGSGEKIIELLSKIPVNRAEV
jgi:hypothetical protein